MARDGMASACESDEVLLQLLDRNGFILGVNPSWTAVLGFPAKDCVGRAAEEFLDPDAAPGFRTFLADLARPGAPPYHHVVLRDREGLAVSAVLSGRVMADGTIACEIWTLDGLARTMERARRQAARDRAEAAVMRTVSAVTDLLARTRSVGEFLRELGLLLEVVSGTGRVHVEASSGCAPWMLPLAEGLRAHYGEVRKTGGAILSAAQLAAISPVLGDVFGDAPVMALWAADETMPAGRRHIVAALPKDGALQDSWSHHVGLFAQAVGNALSCLTAWETQAQMLRQAHVQSVTDPLMRIFNRYKLEETLAAEAQRASRYGTWFSVIIADIDHFKAVNDTYGHPVGDTVLEEIADELRSHTRTTDVLGRWGGEEFLAILPMTGLAEAIATAERLRRNVAQHAFAIGAPVTASVGVAACLSADGWDDWFRRTDAALYRAKNGGRNLTRADAVMIADAATGESPWIYQLVWRNAYLCGQPEIDSQHRDLFDGANRLLALGTAKAHAAEIDAAISAFLDHIRRHFADEERILKAADFAGAATHAATHAELMDRAETLLESYRSGGLDAAAIFHFVIHELFAQHILLDDHAFAEAFAES